METFKHTAYPVEMDGSRSNKFAGPRKWEVQIFLRTNFVDQLSLVFKECINFLAILLENVRNQAYGVKILDEETCAQRKDAVRANF